MKIAISDKIGHNIKEMIFLYAAREIKDDPESNEKTIEELGIKANSTVTIVIKVIGGDGTNLEILVKYYEDQEESFTKIDIGEDDFIVTLRSKLL